MLVAFASGTVHDIAFRNLFATVVRLHETAPMYDNQYLVALMAVKFTVGTGWEVDVGHGHLLRGITERQPPVHWTREHLTFVRLGYSFGEPNYLH